VIGTLFVGLFATGAVNAAVVHQGLLLGGGLTQLGLQSVGVAAAALWSFGATYVLAKAMHAFRGLRVEPDDEITGLDSTQHAETAYDLGSGSGVGRYGG